VLFAVLVTVVLAGCGGSKGGDGRAVRPAVPRAFSWNDSVQCWRAGGGTVSLDSGALDLVAMRAPEAAVVMFDRARVTVSFAPSLAAAEELEREYESFVKVAGGADVLQRVGNAVLAWDLPAPAAGVRAWARGCLRP
jgi:hypothetical protein